MGIVAGGVHTSPGTRFHERGLNFKEVNTLNPVCLYLIPGAGQVEHISNIRF